MKSKKIIASLATLLMLGFQIFLPTKASAATITYTVKTGDSLYKIAQSYKTTVDSIVKLNNITNPSYINIGQKLLIQDNTVQAVQTVNYTVVSGDNLWSLAQKYKTTQDAIMKSNMLVTDVLMPRQLLTIPVNSTQIVKPVGISMYSSRVNNMYGDVYTWENAMRLFTVDTVGTIKDIQTGITFNVKYYGGSNHADIVPLTLTDTNKMKQVFPTWSWNAMKPVVLTFSKGGVYYQMAASLTGMPHSTTNIYDNGMNGHCDLYFYNSTGHASNVISPTHQANVLKASGR